MTISSNDPRYLPQQIADALRTAIAAGSLSPGDRLPSARELMDEYDVSNQTAQNAIKLLKTEGLVETVGGRGTFVRTNLEPDHLKSATSATPATEYTKILAVLAEIRAGLDRIEKRVERLEADRFDDQADR